MDASFGHPLVLQGALFDFDGTLFHNESVHRFSIKTVMEEYFDQPMDEDELKAFAGITYLDRLTALLARRGIQDEVVVKQLEQRAREIMRAKEQEGHFLVPGVDELVHALYEEGVVLAVVTSATRQRVAEHLEKVGLLEYFSLITGAEDVAMRKPDPEPYRKTVEALEINPLYSVAFEDSPTGVQSACEAGLKVVGVLTSFEPAALPGIVYGVPHFEEVTVNDLNTLFI